LASNENDEDVKTRKSFLISQKEFANYLVDLKYKKL
jgi:hypothetical protein